jgi:3-dehydroquinate synthase
MPEIVTVKTREESAAYRVEIGRGSLSNAGEWAKTALGRAPRVCVISNKKIFGLYGDELLRTLSTAGFATNVYLIGDGERFKDLKTLSKILNSLSKFGLSRTDAVISFGGGVVGDIAGFAASIHLRGVDYLQIPTTLLAMVDSSVGGKTGVNTAFGKNLAGAFYQPKGVLIDPNVLSTLPKREITAGFCECIKHGVVSSLKLFDRTAEMVDRFEALKNKQLPSHFEGFLADQIAFKVRIVRADEREFVAKNDASSRKVLNFGHTFAHALEKAGDYRYLKHGEAVGYGIIFAAELSKKLGLLDPKVVNLLSDVVHRTGSLPKIRHIDPRVLFSALRHDKKHINDSLQWVLLKGIGKAVIVPHTTIGDKIVRSTIKEFISSN